MIKISILNDDAIYTFDKESITIGRTSANTLPVEDTSCSRNHCVIEFRDDRYWLTDLRSHNGTKLNGEKISNELLSSGDKIEIGKSTIVIEEIHLGNKTETPAKKVSEIASKPRKQRKLRIRKSSNATTIAGIVVLLTVLWVANKIYKQYQNYAFSQEQYKQALALGKSEKYEEAIDILKQIKESTEGSTLAISAEKAIEHFSQQIAHRKEARKALKNLIEDYANHTYSAQDHIDKLLSLQQKYANTGIENMLQQELDKAYGHRELEISEIFSTTEQTANEYRSQKKYHEAIEYFEKFSEKYPYSRWGDVALSNINDIQNEAEREWNGLLERVSRFQGINSWDKAFDEIKDAEGFFEGLVWQQYIAPLKQELQYQQEQYNARKRQVASKNSEYVVSNNEYSRALQKGQWKVVLKKLEQNHKSTKNPEEKSLVANYIRDIKGIIGVEKEFFKSLEKIDWKTTITTKFGGRESRVEKVEEQNFVLKPLGEDGTITIKWQDMPSSIRFDFLNNYKNTNVSVARFALASSLWREAENILVDILEKNTSHKQELEQLWARWRGIEVPADGFIVYKKRLVSNEEKILVEYSEKIREFSHMKKDVSGEDLQTSLVAIHDDIQKQSPKLQERMHKTFQQELARSRENLVRNAKQNFNFGDIEDVRKLVIELQKRRDAALQFIFDTEKYPRDKSRGQPEVDKLVAQVQEIWKTPSKGLTSPIVVKAKQLLEIMDAFIVNKYPELRGITEDTQMDSLDSLVDEKLSVSIQNFAINSVEKSRIEYNKTVFQQNANQQSGATASELEQLRITNEYRHMMGLRCLRLNGSLLEAARRHSSYMQRTGTFAHNIPGHPDGDSPRDRAQRTGYNSGVGENIFMGRTSPLEAHNAWLHSAGHHRNILNKGWNSLGVGQAATYWTQNFGQK